MDTLMQSNEYRDCSLLTSVRFSRLFYTIDSIKSHDREKLEVEGDYFEACNCDTVCPCVFLGNPDQGECDVTIAWHIDKGHFDDTFLDGLNVVAVFHTPGNMFTGPKWKRHCTWMERSTTRASRWHLVRYTQERLEDFSQL